MPKGSLLAPPAHHDSRTKRLSAVDFFAGCGGLSLGLRRAGFQVKAAIEIDAKRARTFSLNHPNTLMFQRDIRALSGKELLEALGMKRGELDLVAGCPPCQGFSRLRRRNKSEAVADDRNNLVSDFGRLVLEIRPKGIMMENVPGLEVDDRFLTLLRRLRGAGYRVDWRIVRLEQFGIPQRRRRLVLLGWRTAERPDLTKLPKSKLNSVRDAIGSLPTIPKKLRRLHHYQTKRTSKVKDRIRKIPHDGGSRAELPESMVLRCHSVNDGFKDIYGRMAWDHPAPTITGGCINPSKGRFLHPSKNRAISLLEAARLQTFPIWYRFDISDGRYPIAEMLGEALPPRFAAIAARLVARTLTVPRHT